MANPALWALASVAVVLYFVALVIYRLYFHPLAKFPGPKLAAATGWYEAYHDLKGPGGQFLFRLKALHEKYGPVVRLSPDEVHIDDPTWVDTLFAGPAQGIRNKYTPAANQAGTPLGVFGTTLHHTHRRRRAALNPLFSKARVAGFEDTLYEKADLLFRRIDSQTARNGFCEMRTAFSAYTLDIVHEYSLGKPLGLLHDENYAYEWHQSLRALAITIPWGRQFGWIMSLSQMVPHRIMKIVAPDLARVAGMHHDMEAQALEAVRELGGDEKSAANSRQRQNPGDKFAVYRTLLHNDGLPAREKLYNRISHEAVTLMAAGGETTATALMIAVYFLLSNPELISKIREEVESVTPPGESRPSLADLERLPWLTAIIKETLRMGTITGRLTRVAPEEPLFYKNWVLPAGTAVSMTLRNISLDPEIFPEPMGFRPERWLPTNPDVDRCNQNIVAFGRGSRICLGLHLAWAEMYVILGNLFRGRDFELVETVRERDVDFVRDCLVGETSANSKGVRIRYAKTA
ncbi:cytochrome P450 [Poronia punctata]|nr:cytochrome P450 [Poronia punctata]